MEISLFLLPCNGQEGLADKIATQHTTISRQPSRKSPTYNKKMETKKANIIVSLGNVSNTLVQISKNLNEGVYDYNDMLEANLDKLQEVLQEVYTKLQNWA